MGCRIYVPVTDNGWKLLSEIYLMQIYVLDSAIMLGISTIPSVAMAAPALLGRLSPTCGSSLIAGKDSKNKISCDCNGSIATNGYPAHANYYNYII